MNTGTTTPLEPHVWSVRAHGGESGIRLHTGKTTLAISGPLAFAPREPATASELFMGSVAADLVAGFRAEARRERLTVHEAELVLRWSLGNPLVAIGVIDEVGTPAVERAEGTLYVSGQLTAAAAETAWQRCLERSVTYRTLSGVVRFSLRCQLT